ncbi:double zinc ribbon domain-containing protein [Xenophilus azovorans]|uniref:double zinc ribbon domain-containing protein n=1 Tax=Xenophilus azovorans TaxID=151755 RepID=UPI0012ED9C87|nr:zinc ribbon domain-containing protein [Xenophilus azovorans]
MGILGRIFGGDSGGHGSSHGHGNSHGRGSSSGHDWGRNPTPSASGIPCPQCKTINPQGSRFCGQCGTSLVPASCKGRSEQGRFKRTPGASSGRVIRQCRV